jgi:membrane-associated phospholipid phosphatase
MVLESGKQKPLATISRPPRTTFRDQLRYLSGYADLRPDRAAEILAQTTDIASFAGSIGLLHPERTSRTLELLAVLSEAASIIALRFKHALAARRPIEYSAQVQPIIQTPPHSTFPQGHATQAFMQAYVISELVAGGEAAAYGEHKRVWRTMLHRQAIRITVNRVVAGVHFPIDGAAGAVLGIALGRSFVDRMRGTDREMVGWTFDGEGYPAGEDVSWRPLLDLLSDERNESKPDYIHREPASQAAPAQTAPAPARAASWLWSKAESEWPQRPASMPDEAR